MLRDRNRIELELKKIVTTGEVGLTPWLKPYPAILKTLTSLLLKINDRFEDA